MDCWISNISPPHLSIFMEKLKPNTNIHTMFFVITVAGDILTL